ncbi:ankyrin repeat domain-containing protein [Aspergillus affinis]|uniref:ankyrin repeat domain-containing protein n=1 Tax=Aspergillus affinis TaxID=1070780 RepID=UPI0022FE6DE2|nr:uncharacterized protein KD926_004882 [Aspergillus affinis]KAI9042817.1 hypothetical protein KD926_004882 [Aspergillus affinis]
MDVYGPPNVSLDYRLRFSPVAADIIHQLLDIIYDTLLSLKPIDDRLPQISSRKRQRISVHNDSRFTRKSDNNTNDLESDINLAEENTLKITETIGGTLIRLFRLFNAVRKSAKTNRARKIERYRDDEEANKAIDKLRLYTKCYIEFRFPEAPEALRSALVETNALRLRRLNHVIGDLEPFICVFSHCLEGDYHGHGAGPLTFETSKTWASHLQTAHGHTWKCRAPSHDPIVFDQEIHYQEHSIKEHGVPEAHVRTLSNAARRPVLDKAESSTVFSSEALQSHVAGYIKEIALLILQKLPSDDNENAENVDSDQPFENDGPGRAFGITRTSMNSVLDDENLDFQDDDAEASDGNLGYREKDITARVTELALEDKDDLGMTKLYHAMQAGDLGLVESLLQSGASANFRDENGQTPLHYAAEKGFIDCIKVLLKHGADLRIIDNSGFSPFLWAVVAGQEGATAGLVFMDADVNSFSADGKSAFAWQTLPLEEATASGNLITVRLLLECGEDPNHRDRDSWSAIHWAAEEGHLEIVRSLLNAGANPNAVSFYGTLPLHCTANGGHISIVSLLLLQRADPLKSICYGWTALHYAAFMGHSQVIQCLLEDDRIRSTASQQDNHGWSVLHLAIYSQDLATVYILLDKSVIAEPQTLFDKNGFTAEDWLDRGPTSHSQKATGNLAFSKSRCCRAVTSLRQAVTMGNVPMIKLLFKLGHDINGMNSGRRTALYYAAKKGMFSIINLLLDLGADPNIIPAGRKNWKEFISADNVLLRLNRAGYWKRDTDPEVERQIRQLLRVQSQPSVPNQPAWSISDESTLQMPDQSVSHEPDRQFSSVPASSTPPSTDHAASSKLTHSPVPTHQINDNKRKARSGPTNWWKRLMGRR